MSACKHCGLPVEALSREWEREGFCCRGCRAVYALLHEGGFQRFYALRGARGVPVGELAPAAGHTWIETSIEDGEVQLDVQGVHCVGCVWLIEKLFAQHGRGHMELNPTLGRARLRFDDGFDLTGFVGDVESFGYRLAPAGEPPKHDGLLLRVGLCLALAMNGGVYSLAMYLGLREGRLFELLHQLSFGAALLAVVIGGSVFIRSAWQGLKHGLVHLDLPIAIGIVLSFSGATLAFVQTGEARYADTVTVFIALMISGRWLRKRLVERNRRNLLADPGVDRLRTRRWNGTVVESVRCTDLAIGDELVLRRGDLVPVSVEFLESGTVSLEWIDGESEPHAVEAGDEVRGGAFYLGGTPIRARVLQRFQDSTVLRLLSVSGRADSPTSWWARLSSVWVLLVLAVGTVAFVSWLPSGTYTALAVVTAVLVVTCPCAFGIAVPLAYEFAHAHLRRNGVFVRTGTLLDRLRGVRNVVFDKTGTLTTGELRLELPHVLDRLGSNEVRVLAALAEGSAHPKSRAVADALAERGVEPLALAVEEVAGFGVEVSWQGRRFRLGAPHWVGGEKVGDLAFGDRAKTHSLDTVEELRPAAAEEMRALDALGFETWILSGDLEERVTSVAESVGVPPERAFGEHDPDAKATWIDSHDPDHTLMVGDGLNDSLATQRAACSATPAVDRPFMASRCDFYFITPGLSAITETLLTARRLHETVRTVLWFSLIYNVIAVALALAGWMQPWVAAVLMPSSSIAALSYVSWTWSRRRTSSSRSPEWKFSSC